MDYRERKYFFITIRRDHNYIIEILKSKVPTLRVYPPYDHYKNIKKTGKDNNIHDSEKYKHWITEMISCSNDQVRLLKELKDTELKSNIYLHEVTKKELGQ